MPNPLKSVFFLFAEGHGQCLSGTRYSFCKNAFTTHELAEAEREAFFKRCCELTKESIDALDPEHSQTIIMEFPVVGGEIEEGK